MLTLSCIGAGRLGQTLCHLLAQRSDISIGQIINSTQVSSQRAVDFIGCGSAATIDDLKQADIWLIATPDNQIESTAKQLHTSAILKPNAYLSLQWLASLKCSTKQTARPKCCLRAPYS